MGWETEEGSYSDGASRYWQQQQQEGSLVPTAVAAASEAAVKLSQ